MNKYIIRCTSLNEGIYECGEYDTKEKAENALNELEYINKEKNNYNEWLYKKYKDLCHILDPLTIPENFSSDALTKFFSTIYWQASKNNMKNAIQKYYSNIIEGTSFDYDCHIIDEIYNKCILTEDCLDYCEYEIITK